MFGDIFDVPWHLVIRNILSTGFYSMLGIILAIIGYKIYDWITPFSLTKELAEDQNVAVGIVVGSMMLGICLIIAFSIAF
ncbi:DUF350 domain-containing protein [Candidatus Dependentiae bacterium]|nr:DUF350 domain-containing protein [Candidatus Dependentiae bacterium]